MCEVCSVPGVGAYYCVIRNSTAACFLDAACCLSFVISPLFCHIIIIPSFPKAFSNVEKPFCGLCMSVCVSLSPKPANCGALCTTAAINGPGLRKPLHEDVNTLMQGGSAEIVMHLAAVRPTPLAPKSLFSEIFCTESSSGPCAQSPAKISVCTTLQAHGRLHPTLCDMLLAGLFFFTCPVSFCSVPVNVFSFQDALFAQTKSWNC